MNSGYVFLQSCMCRLIISVLSFRMYTLRRVQDAFRANRSVEDPKMVEQLLNQGRDNLDIIQRQVVMGKNRVTYRNIIFER
uniref:Complex 1 LYR protein domain-containing protein n=1 Tax=Salmo trutta TaxID=8032 RepID=A0A673XRU1_SALTR